MRVVAVLLFICLGFVLPLFLIGDSPNFRVDGSTTLLFGALVYASARLARLAYQGDRKLLTLTFWLFSYVWGLLSALLQVGTDTFPWSRRHTDDEQFLAVVLLLVALASFEIGSFLAARQEHGFRRTHAWLFSLKFTFFFGLAAVAVGVTAIMAFGGPAALLQSRAEVSAMFWREGGSTALRNMLEILLRSAPYVACLVLLFSLQRRWRELKPRDRALMLGAFLLILPVTFITNYPGALPRGWLGAVALSFVFLLVPWRRWTMAGLITALMFAFVFVFPYLDGNRARTTDPTAAVYYRNPATPLLKKGDYDVFVQFINASVYVRDVDYMYGRNLLGSVLFWVPRSWWPEKPLSSGSTVGLHVGNPVTNLSSPLWAEGYLALGVLGVMALMGGYGYLVGRLDARYVRQARLGIEWGVLRIFVPFWAGYQIFFLRGPLMHTFAYAAFTILLFLMLARWKSYPIGAASTTPRSGT